MHTLRDTHPTQTVSKHLKTDMKSLLILQIILLIASSCSLNCLDLKDGTFETTNADGSKTIVTRKGNKQTENYNKGERISEFDIKWLNDCEYILFSRKVTKGVDPWPELENDTLNIKILEVNDDHYQAEGDMITRDWPPLEQEVKILK